MIFGGNIDSLDPAATEYNSPVGGYTWAGTESWRLKPVSTDGVIKYLRAKLNGSPGAGKKYTFTLMVNKAPSSLTFEIADDATSGSNMVDEIVVTGGDTISIRCVPTGTPTVRSATWTSVFEGDTAKESLIMGGAGFSISNVDIEYAQVMCAATNYGVTENNYRQVCPTGGTFKNLYIRLGVDPGTAPDAYKFTLRKGGISQALTVTITADDKTGSDLVNTVDVVAGDVLTMMIEPLNTPSEVTHVSWGMTFVADVDSESIVMGGSSDNLPAADTEYYYFTSYELWAWHADETQRYLLGQACTLTKLHVLLSAAPGAGNDRDFAIRIAGTNVVTLQISDAETTGDSGALEDTVALDEYVDLRTIPTSSPDIADAYWGFVSYIEPPFEDGSVELLGKFIARHTGTPVELLGKFDIRRSAYSELSSKFLIPATYSITGVTRDKAGNRLGNSEVALFRVAVIPAYVFMASDMSDANGDYTFGGLTKGYYFVRGQKDGSPNVFDTTDNEVVPF